SLLVSLIAELLEFQTSQGLDAVGESGCWTVAPGADHEDHGSETAEQGNEWHDPGDATKSAGAGSCHDGGAVFLDERLQREVVIIAAIERRRQLVAHAVGILAAHVVALQQYLVAAADAHQVMAEIAKARVLIADPHKGEQGDDNEQ